MTGQQPDATRLGGVEELVRLLDGGIPGFAFVLLDPRGNVVFWNQGAQAFFGLRAEQVLGRPGSQLFAPEARQADRPGAELRETAARGQHEQTDWYARSDGAPLYAGGVTVALRDEAGGLRGFAKVLHDLTEYRRREEGLRERVQSLTEADGRKDEFLAELAHELRNLLTPVLGAVELLARDGGTDPAPRETARALVGHQVGRMARMVNELFEGSRITTGRVRLLKERVELKTLVDHAVGAVRHLVEARGHALAVSLPDEPVWLEVDPLRVEQILVNLLTNAAKFTDAGGQVALAVKREADGVVFRIRDTGAGIPADVLPHLFSTSAQSVRPSGQPGEGLGIGLALARKLTELHGGAIEAFSGGLGRGSEFVVRLPSACLAQA